jgi:hypothetical protein
MNMSEPVIFADTAIALQVSYSIGASPVRVQCILRRSILNLIEGARLRNRQQLEWYMRLIGTPSDTVDFAGLTAIEQRAQCVMIRLAVLHRLDEPHACVILARFARLQHERETGITGLVRYVAHASPVSDPAALTALTWRHFTPRDGHKHGLSLRDFEKHTRVSRMNLSRCAQWLADEFAGLELQALRELEKKFVPHGVSYPVPLQA